MSAVQSDLFASAPAAIERPSDEVVTIIRARLQATLALVKSAQTMPWTDILAIIREENAFRYGKEALPPEEGAALWAEFDVEMDRLYAIMNAGADAPEG
ncbi:MAG TPA: hypothetical protein VJY39_04110 [Acidisphaera sp.]|nr:hypothetical protein [Acidisphaera sp.]